MNMVNKDTTDQAFWTSKGLDYITPQRKQFPEYNSGIGFNPIDLLRGTFFNKKVLDFGCGYGRLCQAVPPSDYLGVDINPSAITKAETENPKYKFLHSKDLSEVVDIRSFDFIMFYAVLLHLSDQAIENLISSSGGVLPKNILIAEVIKESRSPSPKSSPGYGHTVENYVDLFSSHELLKTEEFPYPHYPGKNITFITLFENE